MPISGVGYPKRQEQAVPLTRDSEGPKPRADPRASPAMARLKVVSLFTNEFDHLLHVKRQGIGAVIP